MTPNELLDRLKAYGADITGVYDRFAGDTELYQRCFDDFIDEPNFEQLADTINSKEYDKAFPSAHALKGVSGNLGLTPFYTAVTTLTESLRAKDYDGIEAKYERVCEQRERLLDVASGKQLTAPAEQQKITPAKKAKKKRAQTVLIAGIIIGLVLCIALATVLFTVFVDGYKNDITAESAEHLIDVNGQIKLYIEEKIQNDWKITESIANSISSHTQDGDERLLGFLQQERDIWDISDIFVYTESGYSMDAEGNAIASNDKASDTVYNARKSGRYMTIVQSTITYTVPIETGLILEGSPVVAVSIVQDLDSFIDNMGFSSFDGAAYIYLTQSNGAKISQLTHPDAPEVYNVYALFDELTYECLTREGTTIEETMATEEISAFTCSSETGSWYLVLMPIDPGPSGDLWQLCYFVPEAVVNATTNIFSASITTLIILFIVVFAIVALMAFFMIYISRERKFSAELAARERMFDLLVSNTRNAFALLSLKEDGPLFISSNAKSVIGLDFARLERQGAGYKLSSNEAELPESIARINEVLAYWDGKSEFISDYSPHTVDGVTRYYVMRLYPIDNNPDEFLGIAQDVTQTYEREQAMVAALDMADSANSAKTRFLANMSHDIRTPMNAIINMADFAIDSIYEPQQLMGYLQTIRESADHLLHLINNIMDMSRIESGQTIVAAEPFELKDCLDDICDIINPLTMSKRQTFTVDTSGIQSNELIGDSIKVSQVLINLLNNALKFTPPQGHINFTVNELPSLRDDIASFAFIVEDDGIGISKENQAHIFEPFMRADDKRVTGIEGTGLGLPICQSYVNSMGGTLTFTSQENAGSIFTVELSFAKAGSGGAKPDTDTDSISFAGKRALLCEDNETNRLIAHTILERLGFEIVSACDGGEGVDKFLSSAPGQFDIIYMDIQMPVLNGYQATEAIRASGHPQAQTIPIVAMTANVFSDDVERARVAGMNGYLNKPLVVKSLIETTNTVLKPED